MIDNYYEDRVIAFIDIIGFREQIKLTLEDPKYAQNLQGVLKFISDLKHDNEHGKLSHKKLGKEVSVFSDSIVISYPLDLPSSIFDLLIDIIHLQLEMMRLGILMRGGVSAGKLYHNDNIVYGPAMIRAYDLERTLAIYPRVVVDSKVIEEGIKNGHHDPEDERVYLEGLLEKDEDHQIFVDYMSQWEEIDYEFDYLACLEMTRSLIQNQLSKIQDPGVLLKYIWLKRYYNKSLSKLSSNHNEARFL